MFDVHQRAIRSQWCVSLSPKSVFLLSKVFSFPQVFFIFFPSVLISILPKSFVFCSPQVFLLSLRVFVCGSPQGFCYPSRFFSPQRFFCVFSPQGFFFFPMCLSHTPSTCHTCTTLVFSHSRTLSYDVRTAHRLVRA